MPAASRRAAPLGRHRAPAIVRRVAPPWRQLARTIAEVAVRQGPRILREVQRAAPARRRPAERTGRARGAGGGGRRLAYAPQPDGRADPGEVVWTWVAYEEEPDQGKDRPVLVVGREGPTLLGLMLSSRAERDGQRHWFALGAGAWDRQARPSFVRLDRVLRLTEDGIRREGAVLERDRFDAVADALRHGYGWR